MDPLWRNIFRKTPDEDSLAYFLKHLPTFSELTIRELKLLEDMVHIRNYKADETVFEEGDPGSGMYMIRSGAVAIFAKDHTGVEEEVTRLTSGDFFGETTLTAPAPRTASARTTEATELIGLFRSDLLEMAERSPAVTSSILFGLTRVVSERLQASSNEVRRLKNQLNEQTLAETSKA